jgi:hypothetical protein
VHRSIAELDTDETELLMSSASPAALKWQQKHMLRAWGSRVVYQYWNSGLERPMDEAPGKNRCYGAEYGKSPRTSEVYFAFGQLV